MQFQKFKYLSLRMRKRVCMEMWCMSLEHLINSVYLSLFLDMFPPRPKMSFGQPNVATYIQNIM